MTTVLVQSTNERESLMRYDDLRLFAINTATLTFSVLEISVSAKYKVIYFNYISKSCYIVYIKPITIPLP